MLIDAAGQGRMAGSIAAAHCSVGVSAVPDLFLCLSSVLFSIHCEIGTVSNRYSNLPDWRARERTRVFSCPYAAMEVHGRQPHKKKAALKMPAKNCLLQKRFRTRDGILPQLGSLAHDEAEKVAR